jgi:hypothetical protein
VRPRRVGALTLTAALAVTALGIGGSAVAAPAVRPTAVPDLDLTGPRILAPGVPVAELQTRLGRDPYERIFRQLHARAHQADGVALDDHTIGAERTKAKSTKDLAFEYSIDRTVAADGTTIVPFADASARAAVGDLVRDHLLNMYTRSRLAVPAPLGGSDRDINTSEELVQYSTAYDTLLGAGYDFGAADAQIRTNITDLAAELFLNYRDPSSAHQFTFVLPNNHRSKSAAALGVAALALLEGVPAQGASPADDRAPAAWLNFAVDQTDLVQRWTFVAAGGGYGEGPYYQRYASQNLIPFLRAWDHARGNRTWNVGSREIADLWRAPVYRATQRWMLDVTLPNGGLAPIDDGNVDFSYYFGAAATDPDVAAAFAWRWANAPTPYDTDGSIDLAADAIASYDDSVTPAPPTGSPTRLDDESGTAVFRSGWDPDAVEAVAVGEHGAAMELGRDREGLGQPASAAHEHPDPASYLLHAYGQRLVLDPGYLTFETRSEVNKASDHNIVLVNGTGPYDPFFSSILWAGNRAGPPPNMDGAATMTRLADTAAWDRARVDTAYAGARLTRRFEFVDDRYLLTFDAATAAPGTTLTWVTHGNGGGTSGGTYTGGTVGGRWQIGGARVDTGLATSAGAPSLATRDANHEGSGRVELTHTALDASVIATAGTTRSIGIAYPTRAGDAPPTITSIPDPGDGRVQLRLVDTAGDRIVVATQFADGRITIRDRHRNGTARFVAADANRNVTTSTGLDATRTTKGALGVRVGPDSVDLAAPSTTVALTGLPFTPQRADGACDLVTDAASTRVKTGPDGAVTLHPDAGNSAPAADPGRAVENAALGWLRLDGRGSCDRDGDALTAHWQVVTAPPGSAWVLADADTLRPWLAVDRPGPYRVRLVVTDTPGATSRAVDGTVFAGPRCVGDRLTWNDPRCP